jgi:perosamine synthetase
MNRISYTKPSITAKEIAYATEAVTTGWGPRCYDYIIRFEAEFRAHTGSAFAIATSSCTGAMHMGLAALGVGRGDEVILADTNWVATVAPVHHLGAAPIFVDVLPDTWCIDPAAVEAAITPRTKAIIATHLYGNVCDMAALLRLGEARGIPIVEDAAEAIGSTWHGKVAGSLGRFGTYSFHGTKTMTTGEGGMFVTNDPILFETVLTLSNHGRARSQNKQFWPDAIGYKFKMSNVQAAIGCAQLERINELVKGKRRIFKAYEKALSDLPVSINPEPMGTTNGYWMPTVVFDQHTKVSSAELRRKFDAANIDARVFFAPLSALPMFSKCPENTNAYEIPERAINLPSYHDMTDNDLDRVIEVVRSVACDR